jgi:hypothetical protein
VSLTSAKQNSASLGQCPKCSGAIMPHEGAGFQAPNDASVFILIDRGRDGALGDRSSKGR